MENRFYTPPGRRYLYLAVKMHTVVIGGHARKIGKTSVMAGLICNLSSFGWTAVKITQHGHGTSWLADVPPGRAIEEGYHLTEDRTSDGPGDTGRYLAAGARRSLWLRVQQDSLEKAFPALLRALGSDRFVMIESASILSILKPEVCVFVLDSRVRGFKTSARRFLKRADAIVSIGPLDTRAWPALEPSGFRNKPVFAVHRLDDFNPELCRFVRRRLQLSVPPAN